MIHDHRDLGAFIPSYLDDFGLDLASHRLYTHFCRRAGSGQCWEAIDRMAVICRINRKTAYKALKTLEEHRLVRVERRAGQTNVVTLTHQSEWIPIQDDIGTCTRSGTPNLSQLRGTTYTATGTPPIPSGGHPPVPDQGHKGTPIEGTPIRYSHKGSDSRVRDFEPSIPEPEPTTKDVPVAVPVQSTRREIQFTADPMGNRFSAGSNLPEWRTGPGVNGLRQEFVEWLCKTYLAKLPCNKEQAAPSMADARHWIMSREKYQTELVENQWLAFQDRGAQTVEKTSAAYDWSKDSRFGEWTALADSMNNYRFCYPDGVRDEERVAFYQWLEKQEVRSA